jgi:hypothetical protein
MSLDYCCWKDIFEYSLLYNIFQLTDKTKLLSTNGKAMNAGKIFEAFTVYITNYILGHMPHQVGATDIHLVYLVANTISTTGQSMLKNAAAKVKYNIAILILICFGKRSLINFSV